MQSSLDTLPPEVLQHVARQVETQEVARARGVNRSFRSAFSDPTLVRQLCRERRDSLSYLQTPEDVVNFISALPLPRNLFYMYGDGLVHLLTVYPGHDNSDYFYATTANQFILMHDEQPPTMLLTPTARYLTGSQKSFNLLTDNYFSKDNVDFVQAIAKLFQQPVRFGTRLLQTLPPPPDAIAANLYVFDERPLYFVPSPVDVREWELAPGALVDDSFQLHPFCVEAFSYSPEQ